MLYSQLLKQKRPCPFCKPGERVFASKSGTYLTYAIAPYAKYHLLVISKRHDATFEKMTAAEWASVQAMLSIGVELLRRKGIKDYTILMRNGSAAGRSVKHPHLHIVPKHRIGDLDHRGKSRRVLSAKAVASMGAEIARLLKKK
jgi:diadenosine tetraphosphate (Ap4A) HIT family hydrolase